jgi:hypothetical protein
MNVEKLFKKKIIDEEQNFLFDVEQNQKRIHKKKVIDSWTNDKENIVKDWIKNLEFYQVISYFHLFQVKKVEGYWAWLLIVLSVIVSTISLIQFDKDENDADLVLGINLTVTILSTFITLIASWMKKENYVITISECEKYLQSLSIIISELNGQIRILREDRVEYSIFLEKYKDNVIQFESSMPLISPYDWKSTLYLLTKYYPEFTKDTFPWNEDEDFKKLILMTYHKVKYRNIFRKCFSGYYCYSNCCKDEEENIKNIKEYFNEKRKIQEELSLEKMKKTNSSNFLPFPKRKSISRLI